MEMLPRLSARQEQVAHLASRGLSNKEIAKMLNLGEGTVKIHIAGACHKLGVKRRAAIGHILYREYLDEWPRSQLIFDC